jgi:hypothetical protein
MPVGDVLPDPGPRVGGRLRRVLHHEVRRPLVAMDVRVWEPRTQVAQVAVGEHRVARPPHEQRRHVVELADLLGDLVESCGADVSRLERDVRDELLDRPPPVRRRVRRGVRVADRLR